MNYQISYISPAGHAEVLAETFGRILPRGTMIVNLEREEAVADAEVHLIGFELTGNSDAIPFAILEYLEQLEDKSILFFVTSPFEPNDKLKDSIERKLLPFLPESCDYRGMFVCYGEVSKEMMRDLRNRLSQQPDNERGQELLHTFNESVGHPDKADARQGCSFIINALELNL